MAEVGGQRRELGRTGAVVTIQHAFCHALQARLGVVLMSG